MTHHLGRRPHTRVLACVSLICTALLGASGCAGIDATVPNGPGTNGPPPIVMPVPSRPESSPDGRIPGDSDGPLTGDGRRTPPIGEAAAVLATLQLRGRGTLADYSRGRFGQAWTDIEGDGCDQRNQVLARDMTGEVYRRGRPKCIVSTGHLHDPYTGKDIAFRRGNKTSEAVQIDHVVALANAWVSGADRMESAVLLRMANDPLNLLAVDGRTNQSKGDSDAATWLPPNKRYRCAYVSRQIAVKRRYGLSVTSAERNAMERVLFGCDGQRLATN